MNENVTLREFREDKKNTEFEISEFVKTKLTEFVCKHDLDNIDFELEVNKVLSEQERMITLNIYSKIEVVI